MTTDAVAGEPHRPSVFPPLYRRVSYDTAEWFSKDQVERARRYMRPIRWISRIDTAISFAIFVALILTQAVPHLLRAFGVTSWPLQLVVAVAVVTVAGTVPTLWVGYWRELVYDKRWELSNQTMGGWVKDQLRGLGLGIVIGSIVAVPLYAVIRATDLWWLWGALVLGVISLIAVFVVPVVILPIFNKFTPLADGDLKRRIDRVAALAGVSIEGSFTMDASRRTRRDNAFVTGFGKTKRVVVFDTMLEHPPHLIENVVAHEIGHYRLHHVLLTLPFQLLVTIAGFAIVKLITGWSFLLKLAGVNSIGDPGGLPLFLLVTAFGFTLLQLAGAWLSRRNERRADLEALELLADPGAFIDVWRRMAPKNIVDLEPTWWKRASASHPEVAERMAFGRRWAELNQVQIVEPSADAPPLVADEARPPTVPTVPEPNPAG